MIYQHQYFQLDTDSRKVFDENGKELVLTGNSYRMLVFLCERKHATLTEIGECLDHAKEYTENHIRQYRYKIETIVGRDVIEYKNGIYTIIGEIEESLKLAKNNRNTDLLRSNQAQSEADDMKKKEKLKFTKIPALIAIAMLLLSFLSWPYAFFTLLRIVLTGSGIYYAYYLHTEKKNQDFWFWAMVAIAVLFNPIAVIHLSREVWGFIDLIVAGVLAGFLWKFKK